MMTSSIKKIITATAVSAFAVSSLTACVISDDPYVNSTATAVTTAGVVSLLLYAINDGYYYDQDYNRMPRNYRPPQNVRVVRVNNIDEYRRQNPRPVANHQPQQRPTTQRNGEFQRQPIPHHQEYNVPNRQQPPAQVWQSNNPNRPQQPPQQLPRR